MNSPESESSIERLIKLAGEPDRPAPAAMERARLAAERSWRRGIGRRADTSRRGFSRAAMGLAVAAGIAALTLYFGLLRSTVEAPVSLGRIVSMVGSASMQAPQGFEIPAQVQSPVHAGDTLDTREARVALTFGDSLSLRVDRRSRLRFEGRGQITLLQGALYVDSGGINAVPALRIGTPAGEVRHVGTQFQVVVTENTTRVRVREGRVLLTGASPVPADIAPGDELRVSGTQLQWQRGLPSFGAEWEWTAAIAPPFDMENRPLAEFLTWVAREHGWQVRYEAEGLQDRTREIRLHGSLDGLDAHAMLERVTWVTGLPLNAREGVLWVGGKAP